MFVLDTNTLIYFFKGNGDVANNLLAMPPREIAIPSIVLFELETGITKSTSPEKRRSQLDTFISFVTVLPFTEAEAVVAAQIRSSLELVGKPIGPMDTLIAATALTNKRYIGYAQHQGVRSSRRSFVD